MVCAIFFWFFDWIINKNSCLIYSPSSESLTWPPLWYIVSAQQCCKPAHSIAIIWNARLPAQTACVVCLWLFRATQRRPFKALDTIAGLLQPTRIKAQRSGIMVEIYSKSNVRNIQLLNMFDLLCCVRRVTALWMHSVRHFTRVTEPKNASTHLSELFCRLLCFATFLSRLGVWQEGRWCHERAFLASSNLESGQSQSQSKGVNNWLLVGVWGLRVSFVLHAGCFVTAASLRWVNSWVPTKL